MRLLLPQIYRALIGESSDRPPPLVKEEEGVLVEEGEGVLAEGGGEMLVEGGGEMLL